MYTFSTNIISRKEWLSMQIIEKKIALIPVYGPTELLSKLVKSLHQNNFEIVIVDDGSPENSSHIFQLSAPYSTILKHSINQGKGAALKTGFNFIKSHYPANSVIVTMDGDGQHSIEDAIRLCEEAIKNPQCLILGSRNFNGNVPIRSRFGNIITRLVYGISTGIKIQDTQTGLRAFCANLIPFFMNIYGNRYEYEMNVLLECSHSNIPLKEVVIETIYIDDNSSSHFHAVRDSLRIYKNILKFAASSFTGFIIDYSLYTLFVILTSNLGWASSIAFSNISARLISSITNYSINKKLVFKNKDSVLKTSIKYFSLVIIIMCGNTVLLTYLVNNLGVNRFLGKIITEITFFSSSWLAQHYFIFNNKIKKQNRI